MSLAAGATRGGSAPLAASGLPAVPIGTARRTGRAESQRATGMITTGWTGPLARAGERRLTELSALPL
jgi:hypothetical protein